MLEFFVALSFFDHSFSIGGIGGWGLDQLILPVVALILFTKMIVTRKLGYLKHASIIPLLLWIWVWAHIPYDDDYYYIMNSLKNLQIPKGGFRLYYTAFLNMMLYYMTQLIVTDHEKLRRFLKIVLALILIQIGLAYLKLIFGIRAFPWDSYSSRVLSFEGVESYEGAGARMITLGEMAMYFVLYLLAFLPLNHWKSVLLWLFTGLSLILSNGRTVLIGTVFGAWVYISTEKKKFVHISLFFVLILIGAFYFANSPFNKQMSPRVKRYTNVLNFQSDAYGFDQFSRFEMFFIQLHIIKNNPLFGNRYDAPRGANEFAARHVSVGDTHNAYLGIAALFGLPALAAMLVLLTRQGLRYYYVLTHTKTYTLLHREILWLFLIYSATLVAYLTTGNSVGGSGRGYVLYALADSLYRMILTKTD